jgi:HlyD family secretion protein
MMHDRQKLQETALAHGLAGWARRAWQYVLEHRVTAGVGVAASLVLVLWVGFRGGGGPEYLTAKVTRGDIHDVVDATGTINAVTTVQVGSQVSGTIAKLNADFNSRVHQGDVVALIDPALFRGALQGATADLENAKANLAASKANLAKAQATLVQTKADFDRASVLIKAGAESQQLYDLANANYLVARGSVGQALAGVNQAEAQVRQKNAAVAIAQTNLNYTTIRSPINGIVVARNVDVGQTVAASLQAPTIFTIAQDLTKMQLYAKTDESDVGRIKVGRQVTFKVDAFPKDEFRGVVSQMRMNATTVQTVVTYDTIIDFANPGMKLFPGMTAFVTIPVATVADVVEVPNTALRFRPSLPPEQIRALYDKYGVDNVSRQNSDSRAQGETATVWKLTENGNIEPVKIAIGITDHAYTQVVRVLSGKLDVGGNVVTAVVASKPAHP